MTSHPERDGFITVHPPCGAPRNHAEEIANLIAQRGAPDAIARQLDGDTGLGSNADLFAAMNTRRRTHRALSVLTFAVALFLALVVGAIASKALANIAHEVVSAHERGTNR